MKTKITSVETLQALEKDYTTAELLAFYNELTGETVKRFSDRKTAIRRISDALLAKTLKDGPKTEKEVKKAVHNFVHRARKTFNHTACSVIKPHREGTARAKAITVLLKGATFEQVQEATGWKKHRACYEGIRLLNTHLGYGIKEDDKGVITIFTKVEGK